MIDEGEWLDKDAAAAIAGINPRTLTNKAKNGEIPAERRGGLRQWYFRRADMEALRESYKQPPQTVRKSGRSATVEAHTAPAQAEA